MAEVSYQATVIKGLSKFFEDMKAKSPDKSNRGAFVTEAFLWDMIEKYAAQNSEAAWKKLVEEEFIEPKENYTDVGDHTIAETPAFSIQLKVSNPRQNFNKDAMAELMKKKYKTPKHTAMEMMEAAKRDGNNVRTFKIVER